MRIHQIIIFITVVLLFISLHTQAQSSFDGDIKNNSLAISPMETIAVASYSDSLHVKVYDVKTGKMMVLQLIWVITKVPETKGRSLEQIQKDLGMD